MNISQALVVLALLILQAACSAKDSEDARAAPTEGRSQIVGAAEAGRSAFVEKGCVMCHAVNGVGGKAAPALDAEVGIEAIDPLDFAARMWSGAPAMIQLQSVELGYAISLTGKDIADLAAFAGDINAQRKLTLDQIPEGVRDSFIDAQFWEMEDWEDFLLNRKDQESAIPPGDPN